MIGHVRGYLASQRDVMFWIHWKYTNPAYFFAERPWGNAIRNETDKLTGMEQSN